jgi:hypothetical protein
VLSVEEEAGEQSTGWKVTRAEAGSRSLGREGGAAAPLGAGAREEAKGGSDRGCVRAGWSSTADVAVVGGRAHARVWSMEQRPRLEWRARGCCWRLEGIQYGAPGNFGRRPGAARGGVRHTTAEDSEGRPGTARKEMYFRFQIQGSQR